MSTPLRIYIYGSCVARDTVATLPVGSYTLSGYVARHSLLSHGTDAAYKLPSNLGLPSKFQTRMVQQDWSGAPLNAVLAQAETIDLLLWDLTDERHGVHWFMSGEVVTRSIDLIQSRAAREQLEPGSHVPFGSDAHFEEWSDKATWFIEQLRTSGLLAKTRLLRVNWAETTVAGEPTPASMGVVAAEANRLYARYYEHLAAAGALTLTVPAEITHADPNHRWGLAPFHYVPEVYSYVIDHLRAGGFTV